MISSCPGHKMSSSSGNGSLSVVSSGWVSSKLSTLNLKGPISTIHVGPHINSLITDQILVDSYMVIARYPIKMESWYFRPAIHHAFRPTPFEQSAFEANPNLVPDILIAMGVDTKLPEVQLFNPALAKSDIPPGPITELRYESEVESDDELETDIEDDNDDDVRVDVRTEKKVDGVTSGVKQIKLVFHGPSAPEPNEDPGPRKHRKKIKEGEKKAKPRNLSLLPWSLIAKEFATVWKATKDVQYKNSYRERGPIIANVAISPRGAKWILGVGESESVFVWRMRDGGQVKKGKT